MEKAGKSIQEKIFDYLNLNSDPEVPTPTPPSNPADVKPLVTVAMLHISPKGAHVKIYNMDDDMTKKLSYTHGKGPEDKGLKTKPDRFGNVRYGVGAEDLDRELALNVARQLKADVLVWGNDCGGGFRYDIREFRTRNHMSTAKGRQNFPTVLTITIIFILR